ncbi:hypothetical protein K8B33_01385 [Alcanivorax sp. JB21]|uniref:hypothetical protein n=1 Tax=Alcanivorax limicola TaxID=2874102 RepID=UPI001CBC5787|nr:hypothetical protein [Alcanivorax limicola]MBZ2187738.1 hypothetical protein [Alcanivorax limicola]
MNDTIIRLQETCTLGDRGNVNLLYFHHEMVLMISAAAVGLYRNRAALDDPLGNGVLGYEVIPPGMAPAWQPECGFVREQASGYVGLTSGAVLFIRPDGVALYPDGMAALRNQAMQWLIPYEPRQLN